MVRIERLRRYGDGKRGVSPVIGVILMVAIVVILAAVAGVFLTGFSEEGVEKAPSFGATSDYDRSTDDGQKLFITHKSGDTIDASKLSLKVIGAEAVDKSTGSQTDVEYTGNALAAVGTEFQAADEIPITKAMFTKVGGGGLSSGEYLDLSDATVRIVWDGGPETSEVIYVWDGENQA